MLPKDFKLTGVQASPLFDPGKEPGVKLPESDSEKLDELMTHIAGYVKKPGAGFIGLDVLGDDGALRACFEVSSRLKCANYYALDFDRSKVEVNSEGAIKVALKCKDDVPCFIFADSWDGFTRPPLFNSY